MQTGCTVEKNQGKFFLCRRKGKVSLLHSAHVITVNENAFFKNDKNDLALSALSPFKVSLCFVTVQLTYSICRFVTFFCAQCSCCKGKLVIVHIYIRGLQYLRRYHSFTVNIEAKMHNDSRTN
jgi:hypothetical protein